MEEEINLDKIRMFLYSEFQDMQRLGLIALDQVIKDWKKYKHVDWTTLIGAPIHPKHIRKEVRRKLNDIEARRKELLKIELRRKK